MVAAELLKPYEEETKKNQIEFGKGYGRGGKVVETLPQPLESNVIDITPMFRDEGHIDHLLDHFINFRVKSIL